LRQAWEALDSNQRLAAVASAALLLTMFLPWYSQTTTGLVVSKSRLVSTSVTFTAFQAFSWVEAAVLLVSASVLTMLYARGRARAFRLPGSDGLMVMIAGAWTAVLIFYRMIDKPGVHGAQRETATLGIEWGIFLSLICALALTAAGARMREQRRPGPPTMRPPQPQDRGSDRAPQSPHATVAYPARDR
jgi:hypothetical protein